MTEVEEFFKELNTNPEAQEMLKDCQGFDNSEVIAIKYVEIAGRLGYKLRLEDVIKYLY